MYPAVKWCQTYANVFLLGGQKVRLTPNALAPSTWEELSGTGVTAPALPAIRKHFYWLISELVHFEVLPEFQMQKLPTQSPSGYNDTSLNEILERLGKVPDKMVFGNWAHTATGRFEFVAQLLGSPIDAHFYGFDELPLLLEAHRFLRPTESDSQHDEESNLGNVKCL